MAEEAGIEPARAALAHIGFEDQEGHQTPSTSIRFMQISYLLCAKKNMLFRYSIFNRIKKRQVTLPFFIIDPF